MLFFFGLHKEILIIDDKIMEVSYLSNYVIKQVESKKPQFALKINEFFIHSKYDPIKEAARIINTNYKKHQIHILFGYGLGYLADAFLQLQVKEKMIIIDPLIESGLLELDSRHSSPEQIIYWDKTKINSLAYTISTIANGLDSKINIICTPNYDKLFINEYYDLLKYIREFQNKTLVNRNTVVFFAEQWQKNFSKNLLEIVKDETLSDLHNKFNYPVIVASGGPSLTKQLPLLKEIQEHVIIIAAGSTINSLLAAEIEPDFVVSIDGGEPNYNHFKELNLKKARLIYAIFNHPGIRNTFDKRAFVFAETSQLPITKYLYRNFDVDLPLVTGGGTVAHFSLSIAQLFGAKAIAMIGQDLAYTNNLTHAANNKYAKSVDKTNTELIEVECYYGGKILTSRSLLSMKVTFEEMAKFNLSNIPIYNCTEGGLKLAGYEQTAFQDFIKQYVDFKWYKDLSEIDKERDCKKSDVEIIEILQKEIKVLVDLEVILTDALYLLTKNKSRTHFDLKVLKRLNKIDKQIEELSKDIQIHFLVSPIVMSIRDSYLEQENETEEEKYNRVYKQTHTLYSSLRGVMEKSKENLREVIEVIEKRVNNE